MTLMLTASHSRPAGADGMVVPLIPLEAGLPPIRLGMISPRKLEFSKGASSLEVLGFLPGPNALELVVELPCFRQGRVLFLSPHRRGEEATPAASLAICLR